MIIRPIPHKIHPEPLFFHGPQVRFIEAGPAQIRNFYMASRFERARVIEHLKETREPDTWHVSVFKIEEHDLEDEEILPGYGIIPTSFDVFVRENIEEVEEFILEKIPQREALLILKRDQKPTLRELSPLRSLNFQVFQGSDSESNSVCFLSAENVSRALVEFKLRFD